MPSKLNLSSSSVACIALLVTLVLIVWSRVFRKRNASVPYPPGPKGLPLIQNLLDMPVDKEYLTFADWGRIYGILGPVSHASVLGEHIIVLNSYDAVIDLFEKRSVKYSGRRDSRMAFEIMGWGSLTPNLQLGELLQVHRTLMHKYLQPSVVNKYEIQETRAVCRLLGNLLKSPEKFLRHIRNAAVGSIIMIAYGHDVKSDEDIYVSISDEGLKWLVKALTPGSYLVDYIPWLKYIPDWCPGTQWKVDGRIGREISSKMTYELYGMSKERIAKGTNLPCIMGDMLEDEDELHKEKNLGTKINEQRLAEVLATMYAGGADTDVSIIQSAILAVVLNHNILEEAQKEIDRVVGSYRLPTLADRQFLPYLEGIVREAMRWNPVAPLGVPHRCDQEDIYNGYRVPEKSVVIANVWAILHDPTQYPEPHSFRPERWLDSDGQLLQDPISPMNPNKVLFGFGRRICSGKYLAEDLIYMVLANVFAVFDIEKAKDEHGHPITPAGTFSIVKLLNDPDPFPCTFRPRSQAAENLIREASESVV